MTIEPSSLAVIVGMAAVSFIARAAGFWAIGLVPLTPRVERFLRHLGSAVIVSLVAPALIQDRVLAVGVAITVATMLLTGRSTLGLVLGVGSAAAFRQLVLP